MQMKNRMGTKIYLVVESDPSVLATIRHALESDGHAILAAFSAEEALTVFQRSPADIACVITRLTFTGMSGLELLDRISALKPGVCHLLTSHYEIDLLRLIPGFQKYRANFLRQPFSREALLARIRHQLDGHSS